MSASGTPSSAVKRDLDRLLKIAGVPSLPKARALTQLRLAGSAIGDGGVSYVCSALRSMTTLSFVDLRRCGLAAQGC